MFCPDPFPRAARAGRGILYSRGSGPMPGRGGPAAKAGGPRDGRPPRSARWENNCITMEKGSRKVKHV